jgi:hypothetical protein
MLFTGYIAELFYHYDFVSGFMVVVLYQLNNILHEYAKVKSAAALLPESGILYAGMN